MISARLDVGLKRILGLGDVRGRSVAAACAVVQCYQRGGTTIVGSTTSLLAVHRRTRPIQTVSSKPFTLALRMATHFGGGRGRFCRVAPNSCLNFAPEGAIAPKSAPYSLPIIYLFDLVAFLKSNSVLTISACLPNYIALFMQLLHCKQVCTPP